MADSAENLTSSHSSPGSTAGTPKAWGGVFQSATDSRVERFSESVSFDRRLADDDIDGSIAHSAMLAACGLMPPADADAIRLALEEIRAEIRAGRFEYTISKEDIHLHIESALTARLGDAGRRNGDVDASRLDLNDEPDPPDRRSKKTLPEGKR